jgi:hypothetical protein
MGKNKLHFCEFPSGVFLTLETKINDITPFWVHKYFLFIHIVGEKEWWCTLVSPQVV